MQKEAIPSSKLLRLIIISLMGTISMVLLFLNFPLPFLPSFLKIDFSEVPVLIAALIFSPAAGILVEAIKNLLYFALTGASDPIGIVSNFVAGVLFIVPVAFLYHKYKGIKSIFSGLVAGTIIMAAAMVILNYFVVLPLYMWFLGVDITAFGGTKAFIIYAGILPFNIVKGIVVGILFIPLFIKLRSWIEQKQQTTV